MLKIARAIWRIGIKGGGRLEHQLSFHIKLLIQGLAQGFRLNSQPPFFQLRGKAEVETGLDLRGLQAGIILMGQMRAGRIGDRQARRWILQLGASGVKRGFLPYIRPCACA
jgi:hypothetical protein